MKIAVIGMQWGDEGKGKFIDFLSKDVDWVIRYGGGANAGHTILYKGERYAFHLLPTGILNPNAKVLLGPAMVIDPSQLHVEIEMLHERGIETKNRIFVSDRAHLVLPSYKEEDATLDKERKHSIGTTKKGIGIAYAKRALRTGIRVADIDTLEDAEIYNTEDIEFINAHRDFLHSLCTNHFDLLMNINPQDKILYEGSQGTMLDMDIGTYPFVTSGPTGLNGVYTCGVPSGTLDSVLGVVKAYTSRVGEGPFPTEYSEHEDDLRSFIQTEGKEVGTTTGRLRRVGHLDLPALQFASMITGITCLAVTHLDILDSLGEINICVGYKLRGKDISYLPTSTKDQSELVPILETIEGWKCNTSALDSWDQLPPALLKYLALIENHTGVPVNMISLGPERAQTILKADFLGTWLGHY